MTGLAPLEAFEEFCITRPMAERGELSVDNGYDKFEDIRGDSGTRITIRLNDAAIAQGLLDENKLKPIFIKILETTQYSVAFSSLDEEGSRAIIEASAKEREFLDTLKQKEKDGEPMEPTSALDDDETESKSSLYCLCDSIRFVSSNKNAILLDATHITHVLILSPAPASHGVDNSHKTVKERAKYIPLRLSLSERKMLRLMVSP
jgi:hypothetical protein